MFKYLGVNKLFSFPLKNGTKILEKGDNSFACISGSI